MIAFKSTTFFKMSYFRSTEEMYTGLECHSGVEYLHLHDGFHIYIL